MFLNSSLSAALDRIAERAADVQRAFTPGAVPQHDDVATPGASSSFTLDPLAVAAPEATYFITSDERGGRSYTRNGDLSLRNGRLTDAQGSPIFGVGTPGAPLTELRIDPVDDALDRIRQVAVERDGSLVYQRETIDPRSGMRELRRVVAGRIALARFPAGTRLETSDGSHSAAPAGVSVQTGLPTEEPFGPLAPMHRERSRVDVDASILRLKDAYLAFDALQAAEAAKGHLGKTAMDLLK
jgi:flagellar basal body rod protein FlgG